MTRVASLLAVLLALLVAVSPFLSSDAALTLPLALACAALLLIGGHGAFRGKPAFQVVLLVASLGALARFLPSIFISSRYWPDLGVVFLACLVFGFGLIGFVLDRYAASTNMTDSVAH